MKSYKILLAAAVAMTVAATPVRADWGNSVVKVMIDPGHGGSDPGAGRSGYRYEHDLVLDCSLAMRDWLRSHGAVNDNVRLTRETNTFVDLSPRRQMSINYDPWIFCSVHLNAFNGEAHGTETWYYWANRSPQLAQCVQNQLVSKLGTTPRGVKQNGWTVITGASYIPAILTEGLFVDNVSENNMINSRDKAGFANWVNGHLQGFYDFMTSSAEVSYNGNQGLSNPASDPWSNGNKPTENPGGTGGSDANPAYDANWESKAQVKKNVFAYNIHVDKTNMLWPKVSYQLNGKTLWVKIHAYINGKEVATVDGTTNQRNEVTVDLSNVRERGDVYFTIQARTAEPETGDKPTLIKDDIPPSWTNNWHAKFFNATGVTVNNCTDSPTFGRIIVAESHSCPYEGFVSSTNDKHGRGAMLYAFTPQMQPIPNPDLKGTWGFNGARDWDDKGYDQLGSWTKVRYSEDGRLFAATATSNEGKRGVYELTDNSPNGGSLNGYATRVLSTSYPVTGLDVIGKGNDLRLAAFGPHHMIYTTPTTGDYTGWYDIYPYGTDDVPYLKLYWPNTRATQDIDLSNKHMGHIDTQTLSVAFDPDGNGMMLGNARIANTDAYPIFLHVTTNSDITRPLSDWQNCDGGAVAYNHDRTIFAASGSKGEICLWRVNGQNGGVANYSWIGSFIPEVGSSTRDIAFDYANNIYITGDNCRKDLATKVYIGTAGMCAYQIPESWGGKVETWTPAPTSERIVNFQPAGVVVNIKEVKWTGKNRQTAYIYWDDIANNAGQQPTGYTVLLNGEQYGDNSQIWPHSLATPYEVNLEMYTRNTDGNNIDNTIQVIPYYNGTAEKESNILRIGHTDYEPNGVDAINTNVSMEGGANGQQPVTISWNAPANADVYGYRLYRIVDGKTEPVNCPGDKDGIFPADRLSYRMADAGIKPCKFRVDAMMNYRLKLQNSEISDFVVGKESSTITPETNKRSAPTITELVNYPGRNGVRLSWSWENSTEKPAYYIVERDGVVIVDRADYQSTIDMLVPDGMHTWKVTAVYGNGTRLSSEPATLINPIKREMAYTQYGIEEVYNYPILTEQQANSAGLTTSNAIIPKIDSKFINVDCISGSTKGLRNFGMGESVYGAKGGLYRHGSYRNGYWYIAQLTDKYDVAGTADNMPDGYINYNENDGSNKGGVFRFDADDPLALANWDNRPRKLYDLDHVENQWVAADDGDGNWVNLVTRRKGAPKNDVFYGDTRYMKHYYYDISHTASSWLGYHDTGSDYIASEYTKYVNDPNPSSSGSVNGQNVRVHYVSANGNIGGTGGYVFIAMCNKPGVLRQYWDSGVCKSEEYIELPSRLGPERSNGLIASPENYAFPVTGRPKDFILQLRSNGYYYYNDDTKQYTQIMSKDEAYTAGGITFTYNGEMFLLHPSSNSSNNIGHFRIDMPQRPTDESPYTSADFTDLIPMATFTQKDLTGIEAKNANSMWFGVEPAPEENCMYIYQYVPGFRLAKYRFYSYEKFPPAKPELNLSVCYDNDHTKITHFKVDGNWDRPTVIDQGQEKDYEFEERSDYTLKYYRYRLLDPNMNVLISGDNEAARDQSNNKILEFPKEYFQNASGVKHIDNKVYTLQVQPVYQNKQTERLINGEWASVQGQVDYPADIDPLTVKYYQNSGANQNLFRVDFNFDRAHLANYPDPVDYFTIEMKDGAGNWVSVPKIRIFFDDKMWLQKDDNTQNPSDPYYAGLETSRNYLIDDHIPGTYKFGNRGEATRDMTDKRPATRTSNDPVVAYTIMTSDPSQTEFRAVAHYAATNPYISKSPAKVATPVWGGTTDIADITADGNGVARVHPVPARTDLTVDSPEAINTIVVLSMSGAEVMHVEGNGEHSQTLNISHLPQGNYMLSVNGHAALRWIKL